MKTICIYHSRDLDGWMSGAIVKMKYPEVDLLGWDYGFPIPSLKGYDKIIMCDVSFPLANMDLLASSVESIQRDFIWIDHHASAIKECSFEVEGKYISGYGGLRDVKFAACELTWKYFFPEQEMPEIVRLLGRYDCFGHKGTDEEKKVLVFQYAARGQISNVEEAYKCLISMSNYDQDEIIESWLNIGEGIYSYLCVEARQTYSMIFPIWLDGHKFACVNQVRFNPINFGIDYHRDGYDGFACFHFQNGQFTYSLYNDNGKVDCSEICKKRGGGGHKGAAGFRSKTLITA